MTRGWAIFLAIVLVGLEIAWLAVEPRFDAVPSLEQRVASLALQLLFVFSTLAYCVFAAMHAVQHVGIPLETRGLDARYLGF